MTRELKEICRHEAPTLVKELTRLATGAELFKENASGTLGSEISRRALPAPNGDSRTECGLSGISPLYIT